MRTLDCLMLVVPVLTLAACIDASVRLPPGTAASTSPSTRASIDGAKPRRVVGEFSTANDGRPNADLVAENIRRSSRAFRDDDHRGAGGLGDGDGSANDHDGGDH